MGRVGLDLYQILIWNVMNSLLFELFIYKLSIYIYYHLFDLYVLHFQTNPSWIHGPCNLHGLFRWLALRERLTALLKRWLCPQCQCFLDLFGGVHADQKLVSCFFSGISDGTQKIPKIRSWGRWRPYPCGTATVKWRLHRLRLQHHRTCYNPHGGSHYEQPTGTVATSPTLGFPVSWRTGKCIHPKSS